MPETKRELCGSECDFHHEMHVKLFSGQVLFVYEEHKNNLKVLTVETNVYHS
jgi:hypothetical protein